MIDVYLLTKFARFTDKIDVSLKQILIFLLLYQSPAIADNQLKHIIALQEHLQNVVARTGSIDPGGCTQEDTSSLDRQIYTSEHEELKDSQGQRIDVSAVSMQYAQELFNELSASSEIEFKFVESSCEARAHKMAQLLEEKGIISAKAFIQGKDEDSLQFKTNLNSKGYVNWSYHVAPVIKVKTGKKKKITVKDGWFSSKEIEIDEYIDMVFDPSTAKKPIPLEIWRSQLLQHKQDKKIDTFFTPRFSFRPSEKYNQPSDYDEMDNYRMMSGLDLGIQCFKNKQQGIQERRCEFE